MKCVTATQKHRHSDTRARLMDRRCNSALSVGLNACQRPRIHSIGFSSSRSSCRQDHKADINPHLHKVTIIDVHTWCRGHLHKQCRAYTFIKRSWRSEQWGCLDRNECVVMAIFGTWCCNVTHNWHFIFLIYRFLEERSLSCLCSRSSQTFESLVRSGQMKWSDCLDD